MEKEVKISVRNLVEFVMRSGDIDMSFRSNARALEGIFGHQKIQSEYGDSYTPEITLSDETEMEGMTFHVSGRCDGILKEGDVVVVDEIKTTTRRPEELREDSHPLHWSQVRCYAWFYCKSRGLKEIDLQLTYYNVEEETTKRFRRRETSEELQRFYEDILRGYLEFSARVVEWKARRNRTAQKLSFPFEEYREGQRAMAVAVYNAVDHKRNLFIEAPTGIGKTVSALFPSVKALGEGKCDVVFYLTARTTTKEAGRQTLKLLSRRGLSLKSVALTSKEKICLNDEVQCNPDSCPYAKGHYDRINDALLAILDEQDAMDREVIQAYAGAHKVCPFEYELDIALYCDIILCDYNYVFDPGVYLRRFFDESSGRYVFLVDEAHNLVERGRGMYSCEMQSSDFEALADEFQKEHPPIDRLLKKSISQLQSFAANGENGYYHTVDKSEEYFASIPRLMTKLEPYLATQNHRPRYDEVLEFYFQLAKFRRIYEYYGEGFYMVAEKVGEDVVAKIQCVDPSNIFREILKRAVSTVFFSATLTPINFYEDLFGQDPDSWKLRLKSPFEEKKLMIADTPGLSTRYTDRPRTVGRISEMIRAVVDGKRGNYLAFFPSYAYLKEVYTYYCRKWGEEDVVVQKEDMTLSQREEFLRQFREGNSLLGFGVLGGVFSEGVDLAGERLHGVIVVSVGLPGLSPETKLLREYFDRTRSDGYAYAYQYPGMNKVLQAAGRVIRTEKDSGIVLLIDDRFSQPRYRRLMPPHWRHITHVHTAEELKRKLQDFWSKQEKRGGHHGEENCGRD